MPAPVIVPRDKSLDQVLSTDQVYMLIIGSSRRASELAEKYRASIPERDTDLLETDLETFADDADTLRQEASQYSANDSRSPIVESVV